MVFEDKANDRELKHTEGRRPTYHVRHVELLPILLPFLLPLLSVTRSHETLKGQRNEPYCPCPSQTPLGSPIPRPTGPARRLLLVRQGAC